MPQIEMTQSKRQYLAEHAKQVAPFHWKLLIGFLIFGLASAGLYAYAYMTRHNGHPAAQHSVATPAGASGMFGSSGSSTDASPDAEPAATDSWSGYAGAKGTTLGFGFVGGFVIGFIFRAFLKMMTLITVVIVGGLFALSYYHVINIDMTHVRDVAQSNMEWITDQATRIKDLAMAHLPSSSGGAAGAFFGLRRR